MALDLASFLVAFGIGLLLGLERERGGPSIYAASRTLPLISLIGATVQAFFPTLLPWGLGAVGAFAIAGYLAKVRVTEHVGGTTAIVVILTYLLGAAALHSPDARLYAVVVAAGTTALLASKHRIHAFARHLGEDERMAMAKFLVLALVVLPLLPNEPLDALWGLNLRFVWLLVVFISAIDLAGFLLIRFWGARRAMGLTGILGGLVSSTATMVAMAHHARTNPGIARIGAFAALAATLISLPRVVLEVAVVAPALLARLLVPIIAMVLTGLAAVAWLAMGRRVQAPETEIKNPFRLTPALGFGLMFAVILLAADFLSARFGGAGVYATALVSGIADVDAPTLSFAALADDGQISATVAVRGIILAVLSNLAAKVGIAFALGGRAFGVPVALASAAMAIVGLVAVWLI